MERQRRIWIVNARFQGFLIGYTVAISLASGYLYHKLPAWELTPLKTALVLAAFNFALVLFAMWTSHRIAGPLYRLQMLLTRGARGETLKPTTFRQLDCFPELREAYNEYAGKNEKGFSILELVVVTAITAIMIAVGMATLTSPSDSLLFKAQLSQAQDMLLSARNLAYTRSACSFLTIKDAQTAELNVYALTAPCTGPLPTTASFNQVYSYSPSTTLSQFNIGGTLTPTLTFLPTGGTTAVAPAVLSVTKIAATTGASFTKTITIYPAIGQVRAQ